MSALQSALSVLRQSVRIYLVLLRILVPVMILARLAVDLGLVAWLSPLFAPLMVAVGLPPELGLAWLTAALVGIWAGAVALFTVVSVEDLTTALCQVHFAHLRSACDGLEPEVPCGAIFREVQLYADDQ